MDTTQRQHYRETLVSEDLELEEARYQYTNGIKAMLHGVILVIADLAGLVVYVSLSLGLWHQVLTALWAWLQVLLWVAALGLVAALGYRAILQIAEGYIAYTHGHEIIEDWRAQRHQQNKLIDAEVTRVTSEAQVRTAEADRIRAEAENLRRSAGIPTTIKYDQNGNPDIVFDPIRWQFHQFAPGQVNPNVPSTYNYNYSETLAPGIKSITEETSEQSQRQLLAGMHIPTFAESMQAGLIGPGQKQVLITYELERDEDTLQLTGKLIPYVDDLENNCTMFLGGASKSGKSTLMAHLSAQEALMNALFYVIDFHLKHPERSIAAKVAALSHAFILPPAMTDAEVQAVLLHAQDEALARMHGRETRYSGRPIVFIVDEALALFGRAQQHADNKEIVTLYRNLALFMRDLGTQYNKFGMNGIFATQYVTKDAFKLPGGASVDFRDACQNQALLRLPANQAQAMRLLQREELRGVRQLAPGHGYMGFYDGSIIRMASGNVSISDIELAGRVVQAAPGNTKQFARCGGTGSVHPGTPLDEPTHAHFDSTAQDTETARSFPQNAPIAGTLQNDVNPQEEGMEQGSIRVPEGKRRGKDFTDSQELTFVRLFAKSPSIKQCLLAMHLSYGDYQACASRIVEQRKLRRS